MKKLEDNLKNYYLSKSLSKEKVDLLLNNSKLNRTSRGIGKVAIAAILILGLVFTFYSYQNNSLEMRIIKEVAMNHNKHLAVEFAANDLSSLQSQLDKLDFSIVPAQSFISNSYRLMGGRYCSIQGNLAAQLKVENTKKNRVETLYITNLSGDLINLGSTNMSYNGANIKVWKDGGLLYAIAYN